MHLQVRFFLFLITHFFVFLTIHYSVKRLCLLLQFGCYQNPWLGQLIWTTWLLRRRYYVANSLSVYLIINVDHLHGLITTLNGKIGKYSMSFFCVWMHQRRMLFLFAWSNHSYFIHYTKNAIAVQSMRKNLAVVSSLWMKSTHLSIPYGKIVIHGSCYWNRIDLMYICMILRRSYIHNNLTYLVFRGSAFMMCVFFITIWRLYDIKSR